MKQKIVGVASLMVAMLLVIAFAAGDNQATAATADQTATVTVNENIAINVSDNATMSGADGTTVTSNSYNVTNIGNVQIYLYARANLEVFRSGDSPDTIPITGYQLKNQEGNYVTFTQTAQRITDTKLNTKSHGNNYLTTDQNLAIPTGTEAAEYTNTVIYTAQKT